MRLEERKPATGREKGRCLGKQRGGQERGRTTQRCPVKSGSRASTGLGEATHRQHLLLPLLCHTGPPALHGFLFKKGHKPLRVERVIQQVQGTLLGCLGRLGHVVKIQLQGACDRKGFFGGGFLNHRQPRGWAGSKKTQSPPQPLSMGLVTGQIPQTPAPHPWPLIPSVQLPTPLLTCPRAC